jgi:AcrR family transcriptional regulator
MAVDRQGDGSRAYRSPLRADRAAATRQRILVTAAELFVNEGYAGTTMRAVARAAGVSERTVYLAFPHKAALLAEAIRAAVRAEDGDDIPLLEQGTWRAIANGPPEQLVARLARATTMLWERTAHLIAVAEAAALSDPGLAALRDRGHEATRSDLRVVAEAMERHVLLRPGMDVDHATDVLFALLGSPSLFLRLVDECGWEPTAYAALLEELVASSLTAPRPGRAGKRQR